MADAEVEALARQLRLDEARALATQRGDLVRAFELAMEARDAAAIEEVAARISRADDRETIAPRARGAALRRRDPFAEATVAEASGALDDAIALYERAEAYGHAARIHRARGDIAKAGRALERQVARFPTDAEARRALAEVLLTVGRADAALRALAGLPDDDAVKALRRQAHVRLGLLDEAAVETAPAVEEPRLLFGRYDVVREVSSTASARVLEARDRLDPTNPRVALKVFTGSGHAGAGRDALARFRREVEALSRIDAPSVLRPRAFLAEGPTLVLPWAAGGSVADLLAKGTPSPRRAAEIVTRVLDALDSAHRRGIIHRDVKPANVLLDEAGGAFLADFGVAHLGDASATATAGVIGTIRYMAPEQRRGEPATTRSDLFAVGVLLSELLGLPSDRARWNAPDEVTSLLDALLADDPAERPADAATVRSSIAAIAWPDEPFSEASRSMPPSLRPSLPPSTRFEQRGEVRHDLLLDRDELLIGPDDPRRALCEALAAIDSPALPLVIGVERDMIRVEAVRGAPATSLTDDERTVVAAALTALHRRGVAHGDVAGSLVRTRRGVVLALPGTGVDAATPTSDLAALAWIPR